MIATNYQKRRLGKLLKIKQAWIDGKMAEPGPWPNGTHYWIVQDGSRQKTYHVEVNDRPTWQRYSTLKD